MQNVPDSKKLSRSWYHANGDIGLKTFFQTVTKVIIKEV